MADSGTLKPVECGLVEIVMKVQPMHFFDYELRPTIEEAGTYFYVCHFSLIYRPCAHADLSMPF